MNDIFVLLSNLFSLKFRILEDFRKNGWFNVSELRSGVFVPKKFAYPSQRPSNSGIEMIFYRVISSEYYLKFLPSFEEFRNIDPSVFISFMSLKEEFFFLLSPWLLIDLWVKLVVPSWLMNNLPLSALFA